MGKCSICGEKIRYNRYKIIEGKVYCPNCNPPLKGIVIHKERLKEFTGELIESSKPVKRSFDPMLDAKDEETIIANDPEIEIILDEKKKPKKRRKSKKVK
jgi:ribosomal protein L34E